RAERRADGPLALARGAAGKHEIADVGAGHQQNEHHRGEEHTHREPHAADHLVEKRNRDELETRVRWIDGGKGGAQVGRLYAQLAAEIAQGGSRRDAADDAQQTIAATLRTEAIGRKGKRSPRVEVLWQ